MLKKPNLANKRSRGLPGIASAVSMGMLALLVALAAGCSSGPEYKQRLKQYSGPVKVKNQGSPAELTEGRHIVPIRQLDNGDYVALDDIAAATGFHGQWLRDGSYGLGDNDAAWTFRTGDSAALGDGRPVTLPSAPVKDGERLYVPVSALTGLFGEAAVFTIEPQQIAFFPRPEPEGNGVAGVKPDFADEKKPGSGQPANDVPAAAATDVDTDKMLAYAKKYMGVKYEFGTGDYADTGTFDCSSFTRHIFDRYGISLPRLARQQADKGKHVDRDSLRPGDLLFFYVPGRFKSDRVVGHVGIYMGGGDMIHSSPKPDNGVQITPINKEYWKITFLYAKRYF